MRHCDMPKQCDGYNMKTEFLKHMMSLSIKTRPSVNICVSFQISPQKLQNQGGGVFFGGGGGGGGETKGMLTMGWVFSYKGIRSP